MPKRRRRIAAVVGIALGVYVLLAALPYAFPPAAERAQAAFVPVEDGAEGDRATILTTGEQALAARLNLIANAESSLVVGSYLYADDESGYTVAAALLDAADRGVKVRIVVDGLVGRLNFLGGDLGYALGTHENIEIRFYNPVNLLAPWGLSARFHEKYVIADGRAFVLGGRNISDEFLTPEEHPAYNYDLDVLMWRETPAQSSAASLLTAYFDRLWDEQCAPAYEQAPAWRKAGAARTQDELRSRWEAMETEYARAIAPADWEALTGRHYELSGHEVALGEVSGALPDRFTIMGEDFSVKDRFTDAPADGPLSTYVSDNLFYVIVPDSDMLIHLTQVYNDDNASDSPDTLPTMRHIVRQSH